MSIEVTQGYAADEMNLQPRPTLCLSTVTQILLSTEMLTTLQEVDSVPALDRRPESSDIFLNHGPSVCLTVGSSGASSFREHARVSCQAVCAASDSPNITVCIIRQLPARLVFIIWLTTRDNDYFSFSGKTNIAAFLLSISSDAPWHSISLRIFFFSKKKMLVVLPHISLTLQSPMASVCSELSCWD